MARARDWRHFALLLIDVQRDFWSEAVAECFPDFPANVTRLLALCRGEGIDVVHLRAYFKPDMSDWMARYKLRGSIPCVEGTPGAETLPFAVEQDGELVIGKRTFDGFLSPELPRYLHQREKKFVLTAGLVTSVCVLLTTASAAQLGFLSAVVEDCCADSPDAHDGTLDRYRFMFERTTVERILDDYSDWQAALQKLDQIDTVRSEAELALPQPAEAEPRSERYIIRKMRLAHCKKGPTRCEQCRAMSEERLCLLDINPPRLGQMQRRVVSVMREGRQVWHEFDVVRAFETEDDAKEYAASHGIDDIELG